MGLKAVKTVQIFRKTYKKFLFDLSKVVPFPQENVVTAKPMITGFYTEKMNHKSELRSGLEPRIYGVYSDGDGLQ